VNRGALQGMTKIPLPSTRPHQPDGQQCAILLLLLVQAKEGESGKGYSRVRVAEITLKRLWGRHRLDDRFLRETQEWLFRAGWTLFYAGTTFALVQTKSVEGWPRISSKRLADTLEAVAKGTFDFGPYYPLLVGHESEGEE
jgi:hypothetical protein